MVRMTYRLGWTAYLDSPQTNPVDSQSGWWAAGPRRRSSLRTTISSADRPIYAWKVNSGATSILSRSYGSTRPATLALRACGAPESTRASDESTGPPWRSGMGPRFVAATPTQPRLTRLLVARLSARSLTRKNCICALRDERLAHAECASWNRGRECMKSPARGSRSGRRHT